MNFVFVCPGHNKIYLHFEKKFWCLLFWFYFIGQSLISKNIYIDRFAQYHSDMSCACVNCMHANCFFLVIIYDARLSRLSIQCSARRLHSFIPDITDSPSTLHIHHIAAGPRLFHELFLPASVRRYRKHLPWRHYDVIIIPLRDTTLAPSFIDYCNSAFSTTTTIRSMYILLRHYSSQLWSNVVAKKQEM